MNFSILNHPCRHIISAALLSASGLFTAAGAQELSDAVLKKMGETTAIRMGCGVADVNFLQASEIQGAVTNQFIANTHSNQFASVALWCCFVLGAIRMCPKEKRPAMWKWLRRSVVTWCFTGPILCLMLYSSVPLIGEYNAELLSAWQISAIFTIPYVAWKLLKFSFKAICWAFGLPFARKVSHATLADVRRAAPVNDVAMPAESADDLVYVSVTGDQVQLRHGDNVVTRTVAETDALSVDQSSPSPDAAVDVAGDKDDSPLCKVQ